MKIFLGNIYRHLAIFFWSHWQLLTTWSYFQPHSSRSRFESSPTSLKSRLWRTALLPTLCPSEVSSWITFSCLVEIFSVEAGSSFGKRSHRLDEKTSPVNKKMFFSGKLSFSFNFVIQLSWMFNLSGKHVTPFN